MFGSHKNIPLHNDAFPGRKITGSSPKYQTNEFPSDFKADDNYELQFTECPMHLKLLKYVKKN